MDTAIKQEYQYYENLTGPTDANANADTVFTITEIKSEPSDVNLVVDTSLPSGYLGIESRTDNGDQENDDDDSEDETHANQFTANTIIKEEIMIESEPDQSNIEALEVIKSDCIIIQKATLENQQNQTFSKRRKKVLNNWKKDEIFTLETEALQIVKNEGIWRKYTTNTTDKGTKVIFCCRNVKSRGPQCAAGLYLLYSNTHPSITLFRSVNRHTCDLIEAKEKPRMKLKRKIECNSDLISSTELSTNETDANQLTVKRRKKTAKNWQKDIVFESENDAQLAVKNEQTWAKHTTNKTDKGNKVIYRCRNVKSKGQQCEAGVYLSYSPMDPSVTLFRSINSHTCDSIESTRKPYVRTKGITKRKTEFQLSSNKAHENQQTSKRRKKTAKNWQKDIVFESESDAQVTVKNEQTWAKHTTNKTDKGNKVIYRCRNVKSKGQQCEAGVYLSYSPIDPTVTLFRSINNHTCNSIESTRKPYVRTKSKLKIKTESELSTKEPDRNQQTLKRRKKTAKNWQKEVVFESESDAQLAVKNEQTWAKHTTNNTGKGVKVIYRCRKVKSRGQQCEAGVYLSYSPIDPTVTLFRSINNHTCDSIESTRKPYVRTKSKLKIKTESELSTKEPDRNQQTLKRRKKTAKNWQKEVVFESENDAQLAVKNEQTWAKHTTNKTDKGNKVIYRCRNVKSRGQQCEAGVYLSYSHMDPTVTLFRSVNNHTCDSIESTRKPYVRTKHRSKIKIESEQSSTASQRTNEENQKILNRRKKVVKNWQKEKTFDLDTEALQAVRSEQIWTKHTTNKTDKGNKVIYRCNNVKSKGQQCDAGVYLLYTNTDTKVTLFRSGNKHTCHIIESKRKSTLTDDAKSIIKAEYEKGFKLKHIVGVLINNGFTSTTQVQINNYLAQLRREANPQATLTDFVHKLEPKTLLTDATECDPTTVTSDIMFTMFS